MVPPIIILGQLALIIVFLLLAAAVAAFSDECTASAHHCEVNNECLNASSFAQLVSSYFDAAADNSNDRNASVLNQLRGTIYHLLSVHELTSLLASLPSDIFIDAAGYNTDGNERSRGGYTAPVGYAAIGLRELSSPTHVTKATYDKILQIRELVRSTTEQSLHLCPGTLYIDYTTISQKTEGGSHRPHADNCYHYYDEENGNLATCHTATTSTMREHPHPQRVAASILYLNDDFDGGEFYFANRHGGEDGDGDDIVDTLVPVQPGRMMYFTSGVENLHGALPVRRRKRKEQHLQEAQVEEEPTRRLALAMWYVTDPELQEYVPPFRDAKDSHLSLGEDETKNGPQTTTKDITDPNDPNAPEQLYAIRIPSNDFSMVTSLVVGMGIYLTSEQNAHRSSWKVNRYGDEGDTLHVLFKDHSAMFSLNFNLEDDLLLDVDSDTAIPVRNVIIAVERHTDGRKRPSLQYMLQESVMMHGVLDALSMLILEMKLNETAMRTFMKDVNNARQTLSARRA